MKTTMDKPYHYEIRVDGDLTEKWSDWFDGLVICPDPAGGTVLSGPLPDQAALLGVLYKLQALNLMVRSVIVRD